MFRVRSVLLFPNAEKFQVDRSAYNVHVANTKAAMAELAKVAGIHETDDRYLSASDAAKVLYGDKAKVYRVANQFLSKFVHPTAMAVLAPATQKRLIPVMRELVNKLAFNLDDLLKMVERKLPEFESDRPNRGFQGKV